MAYTTVARPAEVTHEVKGSRFLARVVPIANVAPEKAVAAAEAVVAARRAQYPDASHHCWAYRLGSVMRFSDDGEPGGTAGRPMLEVVLKRDLDRLVVVVTRYFGGTKLGAGGLARAYATAAARALDAAGTRFVPDTVELELRVPFGAMDVVHRLLADDPAVVKGEPFFEAEGMVLTVTAEVERVASLERELNEATRGAITIRRRSPDPEGGA